MSNKEMNEKNKKNKDKVKEKEVIPHSLVGPCPPPLVHLTYTFDSFIIH